MNSEIAQQVAELQAKFKARADKVPTLIYQAMAQGCLLVVNEAKDNLDRQGAVDTGRLKGSITFRVRVEGDKLIGEIGTNVEYGPYVELGTRRKTKTGTRQIMKPRPYLFPAFATQKPKVKATIRAGIRRGMRDV